MSSVREQAKLDDYEVYKEIEEFRKRRENLLKVRGAAGAKLKGAQLHEADEKLMLHTVVDRMLDLDWYILTSIPSYCYSCSLLYSFRVVFFLCDHCGS